MLYDNGFIRRRADGQQTVRWSDVARAVPYGEEKPGGVRHALGVDFRCRIVCHDGRKFVVDSRIDNVESFARSVMRGAKEFQLQREPRH